MGRAPLPPDKGLGALLPAADNIGENMLFFQGFKNDLPTSVQHEVEQKPIWRQKSGGANNSARPLGTRSGWAAHLAQ